MSEFRKTCSLAAQDARSATEHHFISHKKLSQLEITPHRNRHLLQHVVMAPTCPKAPESTLEASSDRTEITTTRWRPVLRLNIPRDILSGPASTPDSSWLTDPYTYLGPSPGGSGLWFPPVAHSALSAASRPRVPPRPARFVSLNTAKTSVRSTPCTGSGISIKNILPSQKGTFDNPITTSDGSFGLNPAAIRLQENAKKTAPLRPQPEPRCTASDCPIVRVHSQGTYRWQNKPPAKGPINDVFNPSNPPPYVLAAYELAQNPIARIDSDQQAKIWKGFYKHHTRPV